MRAILPATVVLLSVGAMPLAGQAPAPPPPSAYDEPEIVVIARKLRRVRLHYVMRGPFLRSCAAEKSSGDERVDRIMCAILRSCVAAGHRDVEPARACMMARLDTLDGLAADALAAQATATPTQSTPTRPARTPDGPDIVVTGQQGDIVVTGVTPTMRGGLWRFRRTATISFGGGSGARPANFTQCLPSGAIEAMLRRAASERSAMPQRNHCGNLRMAFADGRITGSRSCSTSGPDPANPATTISSTSRLNLTGRYDPRRLMLNYHIEEDHDGLERGGGMGWNPRRQTGYRWQVTATREGECPLRERRDQLDVNEIVSALFSEDGAVD